VALIKALAARIPQNTRHNIVLKLFGLTQVRLIAWTAARVVSMDHHRCVVRIPLRRRTRNHLKSMYFGVLCVGADVAGGLMAFALIKQRRADVSFVFKDIQGDFHKRAEADTLFTCSDGEIITRAVDETLATGERVNCPVTVVATCPETLGDEPVATFRLTLSMKNRASRPPASAAS
jgi:acyl-coenzyme A thioesterase PaaI-like protein